MGVKLVAYDTNLQYEAGLFFLADQSKWPGLPETSKNKHDFATQFSIIPLLKDFGLDYIINNCITIEKDKNTQDNIVIRLKDN